MSKERAILSQILMSWAQEHNKAYAIASPQPGDDGMEATGTFFSWVVKQTDTNIDLLTLLDRLELYAKNMKIKSYPDGLWCQHCGTFCHMAEPNQDDGGFLCYVCRTKP